MGNIRVITKSIGTSPEAGAGAGFQFYRGAGALEALVLNYGASADAGTVVTAYDGVSIRPAAGAGADVLPNAADRVSIYTRTSGTDAGTTVPVFIRGDADIVAGTATAGVGVGGVLFARGLFINVTADIAGPQVVTAFIRPLVAKTARLVGTSDNRNLWDGPGIFRGYAILLPFDAASGADFLFKDAHPGGTGNTIMTKTNYVITPGTRVIRAVTTTLGHDEAGADVTTAATGTYGSAGIYLTSGLNVAVSSGVATLDARIVALIEP